MKNSTLFLVLFAVLSCTVFNEASRVDRTLKQDAVSRASCNVTNGNCRANSRVVVRTDDDVDRDVARAFTRAVSRVEDGGNAAAEADAVATAIAEAYAVIISRHRGRVFVSGQSGSACVYTESSATANARAIARAVSRSLARSRNAYLRASERCFARAIERVSITAAQRASFQICTTRGSASFFRRLVTVGYVRAVAVASTRALAAIRDGRVYTEEDCNAFGRSTSYIITRESSG
eukprot:g5303.t1